MSSPGSMSLYRDAIKNAVVASSTTRLAGHRNFKRTPAWIRYGGPILAALVLAAIVVPRLQGGRPIQEPAPAPAIPAAGTPAAAAISVDPTTAAETPPTAIPAAATGSQDASASTPPADRELLAETAPPQLPRVAARPRLPRIAAPPADATGLRVTTTPPGIPFEILASAYETPDAKVLHAGETPATITDLRAGAYRVRFAAPGLPSRSTTVQVEAHEVTKLQQDFPCGLLKVRSQPKGAEIFCDKRLVGLAPLNVQILPGKHTVSARWGGRDARVRTIRLAADAAHTMTFDFRPPTPTPDAARLKNDDAPIWERTGRTVKKFLFGE